MLDDEQARRLEEKIDALLTHIDRFAPLLEKLSGGGLIGKALTSRIAPTFSQKGTPHGNSQSPR